MESNTKTREEETAYTAGGKVLPPVSQLMQDKRFLARFWRKVQKPSGKRGRRKRSQCWLWTARCEEKNYGQFHITHERIEMMVAAHRVSYALARGAWPTPSQMICHSCDNPRCVNPWHLSIGTAADNNEECRLKGRWRNGAGGREFIPNGVDNWTRGAESILRGGSKLTPYDVRLIRRKVKEPDDTLILAFEYDCSAEAIKAAAQGRTFGWVQGENG